MSSYFALWRAILHVPFSPLPLQNIIYPLSSVQRTLCHCERKYGDPAGYCVLAGKRNKQAKDKHFRFLRKMIGQKRSLWRVPCNALYVIARHCPLWGPQKILCTFGEKAQTRKRVSVIVHDNVISKAQFAPHRPEGLPCYALCHCIYTKIATPKNYLNIHFKTQRFFAHLIYFHSNNIA